MAPRQDTLLVATKKQSLVVVGPDKGRGVVRAGGLTGPESPTLSQMRSFNPIKETGAASVWSMLQLVILEYFCFHY